MIHSIAVLALLSPRAFAQLSSSPTVVAAEPAAVYQDAPVPSETAQTAASCEPIQLFDGAKPWTPVRHAPLKATASVSIVAGGGWRRDGDFFRSGGFMFRKPVASFGRNKYGNVGIDAGAVGSFGYHTHVTEKIVWTPWQTQSDLRWPIQPIRGERERITRQRALAGIEVLGVSYQTPRFAKVLSADIGYRLGVVGTASRTKVVDLGPVVVPFDLIRGPIFLGLQGEETSTAIHMGRTAYTALNVALTRHFGVRAEGDRMDSPAAHGRGARAGVFFNF